EAWTDPETVATYRGEYDLAFGFDTAGAIKTALRDGLKADFVQAQARAESAFPDRGFEAPFLGNHDMERVMRALRDDEKAMGAAALVRGNRTLFVVNFSPDAAKPFAIEGTAARVLYAEGLEKEPEKGKKKVLFPAGLAGRGFAFVELVAPE